MNRHYEQVKALHSAFGVAMADHPTELSGAGDSLNLTYSDVLAAITERVKHKSTYGHGGQLLQRASFIIEETAELLRADTIEDQADALTDLLYFVIGSFTVMGLKPEAIFDIVHDANMKKMGPDGKPIFDPQGKFTKPEGWKEQYAPEPRIRQEIHRQLLAAAEAI